MGSHLAHDVADESIFHAHHTGGPLHGLAGLKVELAVVELAGDARTARFISDLACSTLTSKISRTHRFRGNPNLYARPREKYPTCLHRETQVGAFRAEGVNLPIKAAIRRQSCQVSPRATVAAKLVHDSTSFGNDG